MRKSLCCKMERSSGILICRAFASLRLLCQLHARASEAARRKRPESFQPAQRHPRPSAYPPIRFRCQAFLHPGPTPRSVGFAGPGGAFGIGSVSVCLDREVVNLAGILWYIKPQQFRHLFIVLLPDGVDNDVPVLRQILP